MAEKESVSTATVTVNPAEKGHDDHTPGSQDARDTTIADESAFNASEESLYLDAPPPVFWHIKDNHRIRGCIIFFSLLFIEAGILPLVLYFSLRWGAQLSETKNLAIITSLIGTFSGFKLTQRSFLLWIGKGHESRRPIGAGRWGFDSFQAVILWGITGFFVPLIIGSSIEPASPRIVSMAIPCFMLFICVPTLISGLWGLKIKVPFRVSSFPKGAHLPPLTYVFVEDLCAVDGGGGIDFRHAFKRRYEESKIIRKVLKDTAVCWGAAGSLLAAVLIVISWTTDDTDIGYACAYATPWVFALIGALYTIHYAKMEVRRERRDWKIPARVHKTMPLEIEGDIADIEGPPRRSSTHERRASASRQRSESRTRGRPSMGHHGSSGLSRPDASIVASPPASPPLSPSSSHRKPAVGFKVPEGHHDEQRKSVDLPVTTSPSTSPP